MKISTGKKSRPRNILLYGEHGSGKTTLSSTFPSPIVIDIEGGCDDIDVARTDRIRDYPEFEEAISWLITADHKYTTVVVDSVDWLEMLIQRHVADVNNVASIDLIGYGKGFSFVADKFSYMLAGFRKLNEMGMAVVLIAHAKTVKHTPPDCDSYDRREPDLHNKVSSLLMEFVDECLYLTTKVFTKTEDLGGFKGERKIAISNTADRIMITGGSPAVVAKNRLSMPAEIPANFLEYRKYMPQRIEENVKAPSV